MIEEMRTLWSRTTSGSLMNLKDSKEKQVSFTCVSPFVRAALYVEIELKSCTGG